MKKQENATQSQERKKMKNRNSLELHLMLDLGDKAILNIVKDLQENIVLISEHTGDLNRDMKPINKRTKLKF